MATIFGPGGPLFRGDCPRRDSTTFICVFVVHVVYHIYIHPAQHIPIHFILMVCNHLYMHVCVIIDILHVV